KSRRRDWQLARARDLLLEHRSSTTPVGLVKNAYRPGEVVSHTTLGELAEADVDMFTTVIVGNSRTRRVGAQMVTPRGYLDADRVAEPVIVPAGATILAESFRIIDTEVGRHDFSADEWPIVLRMIHAVGDPTIAASVVFRHDAARRGNAA